MMGAIFGIFAKNNHAISDDIRTIFCQSMSHREIDGSGVYKSNDAFIAHNKLVVHSRQKTENQPLQIGDFILCCDARIDNFKDLTSTFFPGQSIITDADLILHAYIRWKEDCVEHLSGEFVFVIWDCKEKSAFIATDKIGFRTIYYFEDDRYFAFSSAIRSLVAIKATPVDINGAIFLDHYTNIHRPITFDKDIQVMQSATIIRLDRHQTLSRKYWKAKRKKSVNSKNVVNEINGTIKKILESQLDSDYPIGVMLSGGLDSSYVTALACEILSAKRKKLIAFCVVLPENDNSQDKDERNYIEEMKRNFSNLEVHYITIPENLSPYTNLDIAFDQVESPVNIFHYVDSFVYQEAQRLGVRTLLTGFGGDMAISNSGTGVIYYYMKRGRLLKCLRLLRAKYRLERHSLINIIKMEFLGVNSFYLSFRNKMKFNLDYRHYPFNTKTKRNIFNIENRPYRITEFEESIDKWHLGYMLTAIRKMSLNYQIEALSPLLHYEFCKLYLEIPLEYTVRDGIRRNLIRDLMRNIVPELIRSRMDKNPYCPDANRRLAYVRTYDIKKLRVCNEQLMSVSGLDLNKLEELISGIEAKDERTMWRINDRIVNIPIAIIAAEFYLWIKKKFDSVHHL